MKIKKPLLIKIGIGILTIGGFIWGIISLGNALEIGLVQHRPADGLVQLVYPMLFMGLVALLANLFINDDKIDNGNK